MAFPYVRAYADWKNAASASGGGDESTPINEAALDTIEAGIKSLSELFELVSTKGDVLAATGDNAYARLAAGANDTLMVADSAQSAGLKYAKLTNAMVDAAAAIAQSKIAFDAWQTWVPAWTSTGTAPALGNSVILARYVQIGKTVHVFLVITFGSTATFGTGSYRFSLPVDVVSTSYRPLGFSELSDNSSGAYGMASVAPVTVSTVQLVYGATYLGVATVVGQTAPWTWAQNDFVAMNLKYEVA